MHQTSHNKNNIKNQIQFYYCLTHELPIYFIGTSFPIIQLFYLGMGMFYNEQEKNDQRIQSDSWAKIPICPKQITVSGKLYEHFAEKSSSSQIFYANPHQIYFQRNGDLYIQELHFCVLEQHFCLYKKQRIYEFKLKSRNGYTKLSTDKLEVFTAFYVHLAKYCILPSIHRHYKVKQQIGQGAFSKVYNGQNVFSKEEVALKIFTKQLLSSKPEISLIIKNQIQTLRNLKDNKLSPIIGVYETPDSIVLVLQKAEAGNMISYLKEHQKDYNQEFVRSILYKVAENLNQLHKSGYIHRDLKPQNILFKNEEVGSAVFFGDFGVTVQKQDANTSKIGTLITGTVGFMAPQILKGLTYDEKCDMFSYGCLIYYLYTGNHLFKKKDMSYLIRDPRALEQKIKFLYEINPLIYDLLTKLIKICPEERLTADETLQHEYFSGFEHHRPTTGQQDRTFREFINARINKFFL